MEQTVQPRILGKLAMSPFRARAELFGAEAILAALHALPLRVSAPLAATVARSAAGLVRGSWRTGTANLARAYPELSAARRQEILHGAFANFGRMVAEMAHFDTLEAGHIEPRIHFSSPEARRLFEPTGGAGPAIIATGHLGNWELLIQVPAMVGRAVHLVHRPIKNPLVDAWLARIRSRIGTQLSVRNTAARGLLKTLHQGGLIAIPIDQHQPGGTGVPVPFFGRPASTTLGPARIAQLAQVPIRVAGLIRLGQGFEHELLVFDPIPPPPRSKDPGALIATMTLVNQQFESLVRAAPEQWLWMHRRWRLD